MKQHIEMLGQKATDKVTGFTGTVSTVSFDLYGCIQAVLSPPLDNDGKKQDGHWFDIARLETTGERVMDVPDYENQNISAGEHGAAEKPSS